MTGTTRRALWGLILVSGALRLAWAASLGPGNDEAYHSLFVENPAWSYFDHPPMLAWVEALGIALAGGRVTAFSLRIGFVSLFAGSTWLMARLGTRLYGERAGLLAAFGLNVTAYHTVAAGTFALPDGPLLFFWLLTLDRLTVALGVAGPGRRGVWPWVGVGLAWGGALLSKYHGIFPPVGVLAYLVLEPSARVWLRRPGPYLAVAIGLVVFSPVLAWNASHGWASFAFQGGRALGESGVRPLYLLGALLGPVAYLFPWIWARLVGVLARLGRRALNPATPSSDRFLLAQSVAPLSTFLVVACTRPVLPHWALVGFLPLYPLLGKTWAAERAANPSRFGRRAAVMATIPIALCAMIAWHARTGVFQGGLARLNLVSPKADPTVDLHGWDRIADELNRRGLLRPGGPFLFTADWYLSGQLAFATRGTGVPVLCYHAWDARSFAFWSRPEDWVGRDGILVAVNSRSTEPGRFDRWFQRITPLGSFDVLRGGVPIRTVRLFHCERQTVAFPFDDLGKSIHPQAQVPVPPRLAGGKSGRVD
ncbi:MAG: ArnT family glycosyltransferase [Isosphaeraceae bacterium]